MCLYHWSTEGNTKMDPNTGIRSLHRTDFTLSFVTKCGFPNHQTLCFNSGKDVHADFQTLNGEINSPSASYILKLANRLYGESTTNFLSVGFGFAPTRICTEPNTVFDWIAFFWDYRNSWTPHRSTTMLIWRRLISSGLQRSAEQKSTVGLSSKLKVRTSTLIRWQCPSEDKALLKLWFDGYRAYDICVCISDKIKDLLKPGSVNSMTRLALVNAIYFKGNWMNRFDVANTKEMPFKVNQVTSAQQHEPNSSWSPSGGYLYDRTQRSSSMTFELWNAIHQHWHYYYYDHNVIL